MSRSKWKGNFIDLNFKKTQDSKLKICNRNIVISQNLIGGTFHVYNGKYFKNVKITREKVGFKFGEFSFTKNLRNRNKEKKIKLKKKKQ